MKLKQSADDFHVEEITESPPKGQGQHALYRLEKRGWSTPDAIGVIRRRWRLGTNQIAAGGFKDRHAHTIQYLTIPNGPHQNLSDNSLDLQYLGQVDEPFSSRGIRANRFRIVLRDLTEEDSQNAIAALERIRRDGVPNYFDDQRFGSVVPDGEFVGKLMVLGKFEAALKLALTASYEFDRSHDKRAKVLLRKNWGRWVECHKRLPRGHLQGIIQYLIRRPEDYRGALARLHPELQGLCLSVYQSHLWNRIAAARLAEVVGPDEMRPARFKLGDLPMPVGLDANQLVSLKSEILPLPTARWPMDPEAPWATSATQVLATEGLAWEDLKIKGLRRPFFSRGERALLCHPDNLTGEACPDDLHPHRNLLRLSFDLPRGSYATVVVKRLLL